ncbi:hypothetical protein ACR56S_03740 [Staphylococcus hominis]|uniref:hypothetical protein n=1 Tax=Staphylococcus hominis TaxID=1290 RepID=UPI003DA117E5
MNKKVSTDKYLEIYENFKEKSINRNYGKGLKEKCPKAVEEKVYEKALELGYPKDVLVERLRYEVDAHPNITVEQATDKAIEELGDDAENKVIVPAFSNLFYTSHPSCLDIKITIITSLEDYNNANHDKITQFVEHYDVDLSKLNDEKVIKAIEENSSSNTIFSGQGESMIEPVNEISDEMNEYYNSEYFKDRYASVPYQMSGEDFGDILYFDKPKFDKELVKPTNLTKVNEMARNLINKFLLDSEEKLNKTLYEDGKLLDVIISNKLFEFVEPNDDVFSIRYICDEKEMKNITRNYMHEKIDDIVENDNFENVDYIAKRMKNYYDEQALTKILLKKSNDTTNDKNITFRDLTVDLKTDFETFAQSEVENFDEYTKIQMYLDNEFYNSLINKGLVDLKIGDIDIDKDDIKSK